MDVTLFEKIRYIGKWIDIIKNNNYVISQCKKVNDYYGKMLKDYANDSDIQKLICEHLHIEDNGKPRELETKNSFSSTNGESGETIEKYPNPDASFNPELDEFEIHDFEVDIENDKIRIQVECIRRRKFILYDMWEPDLYWTDWISTDEL